MSTSKDAYCATVGHYWSAWSDFRYAMPPLLPITLVPISNTTHKTEEPSAYRWRQCGRCGVKQRQSWKTNEIEDVSDEN